MVHSIVNDMFNNTDETGTLIIKGWDIEPEETGINPRFIKCRMNWDFDTAEKIADDAAFYCDALEAIGEYYSGIEKDVYCEPDFESCFDDSYAAQLREVWELFFGGYDGDKIQGKALCKLAQQRLGGKQEVYNTFVRARRIERVVELGAPDCIIDKEKYEFVRAFVLNRACEDMTDVDISKDSFEEKTLTLGDFNEDDIDRIFEMLFKDCSMMPEERVGYTMLVNMVFGDIRLDLYRRYDTLKPAVDTALETLSTTEREVLEKRFGLTDGVRRSYETTALEMHTPAPMIMDYEAIALRKLRHPGREAMLEKLLYELHDNPGEMTETDAFIADAKLADFRARAEKGELTQEEQATLDLLTAPLPDDLKELFE